MHFSKVFSLLMASVFLKQYKFAFFFLEYNLENQPYN
jgi:hypothetical protein